MRYIQQLDSVRAIAAILVICWHWIPITHWINTFDNGAIGVDTFFVLSGFLITGILLKYREETALVQGRRWKVFKNFYMRRALRIFPVYYFLIFLIFIFHSRVEARFPRIEFFSSLTYTINFYFAAIKQWGHLTVHFWSLAVEEQFYLFWPFIILLCKKKYMIPLISFFILVSVVAQCLITDPEFGYILTYTCFDAFGLGALLAWVVQYHAWRLPKVYKVLSVTATLSICILIIQVFTPYLQHLPQRTIYAVIALWLITFIVYKGNAMNGAAAFILNNKLLQFLGKISYGIYLYHVPVQWGSFLYINFLETHFGLGAFFERHEVAILLVNFLLLIGIAWLSWLLIEKPILRLKTYFDNSSTKEPAYTETAMQAP